MPQLRLPANPASVKIDCMNNVCSRLSNRADSALPAKRGGAPRPGRWVRALVIASIALLWPTVADAAVLLRFHSFTGSVFGRYPHAFIELSGTLDSGRPVHENYGYTAVHVTPALLAGNVRGTIESENEGYLRTTNVHFSVPVSDAQYWAIVTETGKWRDDPGKSYNLNTHNCVSFVARIAQMVGLQADIPAGMIKHPKAWLNYVGRINPQLHAVEVR